MLRLTYAVMVTWLAGCGGGMPDEDAGMNDAGMTDGGPASDCAGATNGRPCGDGYICVDDACAASTCGDGVADLRTESCDDGNAVAFDGCNPDCSFTCAADTECDDQNACNGLETCNVSTHVCDASDPLVDGASCARAGGEDGVCFDAGCVALGCSNMVVDGTEQCDDGMNGDDTDGCKDDCTFSCEADSDCSDDDVCNGIESCDAATHICSDPVDLDCTPADACHTGVCDSTMGCLFSLIDGDGDMHASDTLGACGDDCNDAQPTIYRGAEELCDGLDNNCINGADEVAPSWYIDCDRDEFSDTTVGAVPSCTEPIANPGCPAGAESPWTSTRPLNDSSTDCDDGNAARYPGATEGAGDGVDANCDGSELCFLDNDDDGYRRPDGATTPSLDVDCIDAREARASDPSTDCNDSSAAINPGATEGTGDLIDQNCDGRETCFADADTDTFRSMTATVMSTDSDCTDSGEAAVSVAIDCCDMDARQNPGSGFRADATGSTCGGSFDWNCDGTTTQLYTVQSNCTDSLYPSCTSGRAGWYYPTPPPCGRSDTWVDGCGDDPPYPGCMQYQSSLTQACQ